MTKRCAGSRANIEELARDAGAGAGKRAFGVWLSDRLGGYVDYDSDVDDGLEPGDVNLTHAVDPWVFAQVSGLPGLFSGVLDRGPEWSGR